MASTPPLRIISVHDPPPTPRHGPAHDDFEPRYSTRSTKAHTSYEVNTTPEPPSRRRALRSATTPESKRLIASQPQHQLSPPTSPHTLSKHNLATRAQIPSPTSPATRARASDTSSSNPSFSSSNNPQSFLTNTTVMADGMLPTPVKTPRKKYLSDVKATGRVLFQELPHPGNEIMPTPKMNRRSKRHTGLSLEGLTTGSDVGSGSMQIFTDSRDIVPQIDLSEENPFQAHEASEASPTVTRVAGTSKRRKLKAERKGDPQVDEAIKNDEGLVYVFRGKKVFKRFDDGPEDEESTVDPVDLGLLSHNKTDAKALSLVHPLTRKSIRPKRLFQTEDQIRAREAEMAEEEVTDIEEGSSINTAKVSVSAFDRSKNSRPSRRAAVIKPTTTSNADSLGEGEGGKSAVDVTGKSPTADKATKPKRGSPFDSWKRVKPGTSTSTVGASKGRKRASSALVEGVEPSAGKKPRNR